eukprot:12229228-Alexandrium_andersonii.AAC.1
MGPPLDLIDMNQMMHMCMLVSIPLLTAQLASTTTGRSAGDLLRIDSTGSFQCYRETPQSCI